MPARVKQPGRSRTSQSWRVSHADHGATSGEVSGARGPLELIVLAPNAVRSHALPTKGLLAIGRADGNDVVIDDPSVSRRHAVLHVGSGLMLEDLGSANGTRLQGLSGDAETARLLDVRLGPNSPQVLRAGDTFVLGAVRVAVREQHESGEPSELSNNGFVVATDPAMRELYAMAARVARIPISVLVLGETGVGKEILAEHIHRTSPRCAGPFVKLNCAALSESLLESELFGHEKGAFTGAVASKPGLLEVASGGSVFLDEVGELPAPVQAKLLRVVEERRVLRVGGLEPRSIDVRIISATHRDLESDIRGDRFRADLYYRLNGVTLSVPPLRNRVSEIEPLAIRFLNAATEGMPEPRPFFSVEALRALQAWHWPGNVRELRNAVERAVALSSAPAIEARHLVLGVGSANAPFRPAPPAAPTIIGTDSIVVASREPTNPPASALVLADREKRARILHTLEQTGWNQKQAAAQLGISLRTLINWLERYAIPRPRKKG